MVSPREFVHIPRSQWRLTAPGYRPIPFIRIDALLLLIVWYLPFYHPTPNSVGEAWKIAGTFIPISFGWAAGDVSLAAYIQSSLARVESKTTGVSALGAVMSFLYVLYVSCLSLSLLPSCLFARFRL